MSIKKVNVRQFVFILIFFAVILLFFSCSLFHSQSDEQPAVQIVSCLTRYELIHIDDISLRSAIIAAFNIRPLIGDIFKMSVSGELFHNGKLIAEDEIYRLDSLGNNLSFDVLLTECPLRRDQPLTIPAGEYRVVIKLFNEKKHLIAQAVKEFERNQIGRTFDGFDKVYEQPQYIQIRDDQYPEEPVLLRHQKDSGQAGMTEQLQTAEVYTLHANRYTLNYDRFARDSEKRTASLEDRNALALLEDRSRSRHKATDTITTKKDYVIFQRSYLERVYPDTQPKEEEIVADISTEMARNETKPFTFSVRANKDLGIVRMSIAPLKDKQGKTADIAIRLGAVNQLTEVVKEDKKNNIVYYRYAPKIIEEMEVIVPQNKTQTYWITIKTDNDTKPGDYHASIKVMPRSGKHTEIPVHVKVLPITLTDTDKQYGMMMDYAFYELDNQRWTDEEKRLLEERGREIYRDLRAHGMTVVYPHSHFYYRADMNGEPILDSLRASLESYKKEQFPGPFVWYLGHLLQTAKTKHPGSILGYDSAVAKKRLQDLLTRFEKMAIELGIPKEKLIVQLVDEPDPDQKERMKAARELHKEAKKLGFNILITRPWSDADVMCTALPANEKQAEQLRDMGHAWWIYPNDTLTSKNLAYTRYVFGFGAWRWEVDGVVPWTYQMSQGSNGNPFTVLDGPEVMVAYPGVNGPIPTPTWEAIRDGINDYKYMYQLQKLISAEKAKGNPAAVSIEGRLLQLRNGLGKPPGPEEYDYGDWSPEAFEKKRKQIVEWAMALSSNR